MQFSSYISSQMFDLLCLFYLETPLKYLIDTVVQISIVFFGITMIFSYLCLAEIFNMTIPNEVYRYFPLSRKILGPDLFVYYPIKFSLDSIYIRISGIILIVLVFVSLQVFFEVNDYEEDAFHEVIGFPAHMIGRVFIHSLIIGIFFLHFIVAFKHSFNFLNSNREIQYVLGLSKKLKK